MQERWQNNAWTGSSTARPIRPWSRYKRACSETVRRTSFPVHLPRHVVSCKTQHVVHLLSLKNGFRARLPSKSDSWRCENEAFVRDFRQNLKVQDVETKLACETSLKSESGRCENEAFVRDFSWLWDPLAVRSLGCGDLLAVRSFGWEISWLWRSLGCKVSWLWDLLAVRSLGCEISWLWRSLGCGDLLAVRSLGCEISWLWRSLGCGDLLAVEISWLWDLLAVRSLGCGDLLAVRSFGCGDLLAVEISWLWDLLAVEISWLWDLLLVEISWLWDLLAVRSHGCDISWLWWIGFRKSVTRKLTFKLPFDTHYNPAVKYVHPSILQQSQPFAISYKIIWKQYHEQKYAQEKHIVDLCDIFSVPWASLTVQACLYRGHCTSSA